MVRVLIFALLAPVILIAGPLPDQSIYHIGSQWQDQNNRTQKIEDFRGKVWVLAFVYTYCEHSCPIILANLKQIEARLDHQKHSDTGFLLVSLDPKRDTPEVLHRYMSDHNLDTNTWTMLNGDPDDVLELSALVGVRYRPMDAEGTDIAHSNMITILDRNGRIHYQMQGLDESIVSVIEAIDSAINL